MVSPVTFSFRVVRPDGRQLTPEQAEAIGDDFRRVIAARGYKVLGPVERQFREFSPRGSVSFCIESNCSGR